MSDTRTCWSASTTLPTEYLPYLDQYLQYLVPYAETAIEDPWRQARTKHPARYLYFCPCATITHIQIPTLSIVQTTLLSLLQPYYLHSSSWCTKQSSKTNVHTTNHISPNPGNKWWPRFAHCTFETKQTSRSKLPAPIYSQPPFVWIKSASKSSLKPFFFSFFFFFFKT